jgi:hypothetical protein
MGPSLSVKLVGHPRFPRLIEDSLQTFRKLRQLRPDIYLLMHPEEQFAGKLDRLRAGDQPNPLYEPGSWIKLLDEDQADLEARVKAARASAAGH